MNDLLTILTRAEQALTKAHDFVEEYELSCNGSAVAGSATRVNADIRSVLALIRPLLKDQTTLDRGAVSNLAIELLKQSPHWRDQVEPEKLIRELIYAHLDSK